MIKKFLRNLLAGAILMASAVVQAQETNVPDIYGSVIFALGWEDMSHAPYGIYAIKGGNGLYPEGVITDDRLYASGGGVYVDGLYHFIYYKKYNDEYAVSYRVCDVRDGWKVLQDTPLESLTSVATDLTYNPADGKIYGCFNDGRGGYFLGTLNELTGESHNIAPLSEQLLTISANQAGDLYGIGKYGDLYAVDPMTAELTKIGSTGKAIRYAQSATFDYPTNRLYWVMTPHDFQSAVILYEVNTSDATVKEISRLPDRYEFTGLFTESPYTLPEAPAHVTDLQLAYPQGALNGTISFQLPTTTFAGQSITGSIGYKINIDGEEIYDSSALVGQTVSVRHRFATGLHYLKVTPYNASGRGSAFATYLWAGIDTPKAQDPTYTVAETMATISWQAPIKGINGGYIDPDKLSYRVVRQPDNYIVYEGIDTQAIDDIRSLPYAYHWYDIVTLHNGIEGASISTEKRMFGEPLVCPYKETFSNENSFDTYTIIDNNQDSCSWYFDEQQAIYSWSVGMNADDWLITPPILLERENVYRVSFDISKDQYYNEIIAVSMGDAPSIANMTEEILPPTTFSDSSIPQTEAFITTNEDLKAHFGFHVLSDYKMGSSLYLDNIAVTKVAHTGAPGAPQLQVVPGDYGDRSATIRCTLPTQMINGTQLSTIEALVIYRDGVVVQTISDVKPGQQNTWIDRTVSTGMHTYQVTARNNKGQGMPTQASVYIGEDLPNPVSNISLKDLGDGNVELSWDAPTIGKNGGYINPEHLAYRLQNIGGDYGAVRQVSSTSITDKLYLKKEEQKMAWYIIEAYNNIGTSEPISSDTLFLGAAYTLPYKESFARRSMDKGPWGFGESETFKWTLSSAGVYTDPQDADGGMVEFRITNGPRGVTSLVSPKLSLGAAENPVLTFYLWHNANADNRLKVFVRTPDGQKTEIAFLDQSDTGRNGEKTGWIAYTYHLSDYRTDDYVQIIFTGINVSADVYKVNELFVDNISVVDVLPYDLAVASFEATEPEIPVGEVATFWVSYENKGYRSVEDYKICLLRDGQEVSSVKGEPINPSETKRIKITDIPNGDVSKSALYTAQIDSSDDTDTSNNSSSPVVISVLPGKPYVDDLNADIIDNKVVLSWSQPIGAEGDTVGDITEDFEDYEPFIIKNIGEWTLYDVDKSNTAGIQDGAGNFFEYPNVTEPMAFQLFNPSKAGLTDAAWKPHSGEQVLAAFTSGYAQNDDWLISKPIDGKQTISFWARSPKNTEYGTNEVVEVLYSTASKELSDFSKVGNTITVPGTWTRYEYELPEGATYFAIRCISKNQYVLFIDDISYRPVQRNFSLTGYNVYRDDHKLNAEPITAITYTDDVQVDLETTFDYYVTAVYNIGESVPSNSVEVDAYTSIETPEYQEWTVETGLGTLTVSHVGSSQVFIFAADGSLVCTTVGDTTVRLDAGVYIVRVNGRSIKVIVL